MDETSSEMTSIPVEAVPSFMTDKIPKSISVLSGFYHLRRPIPALPRDDDDPVKVILNPNAPVPEVLEESVGCGSAFKHWREIFLIIAVTAFWSVCYYSCFVWLVYFTSVLMFDGEIVIQQAWWINLGMSVVLIILFPLGGLVGDMVSRYLSGSYEESKFSSTVRSTEGFRYVMMFGALIMIGVAVPGFILIEKAQVSTICIAQFSFAVALALYGGNMPAYLVYKVILNIIVSSCKRFPSTDFYSFIYSFVY